MYEVSYSSPKRFLISVVSKLCVRHLSHFDLRRFRLAIHDESDLANISPGKRPGASYFSNVIVYKSLGDSAVIAKYRYCFILNFFWCWIIEVNRKYLDWRFIFRFAYCLDTLYSNWFETYLLSRIVFAICKLFSVHWIIFMILFIFIFYILITIEACFLYCYSWILSTRG